MCYRHSVVYYRNKLSIGSFILGYKGDGSGYRGDGTFPLVPLTPGYRGDGTFPLVPVIPGYGRGG